MNGAKEPKRLIRPRTGRIVAGVCAGVSDFLGIDATLVRVILAVVTVISAGAGALLYLAAWILIPEEGESTTILENMLTSKRDRSSG